MAPTANSFAATEFEHLEKLGYQTVKKLARVMGVALEGTKTELVEQITGRQVLPNSVDDLYALTESNRVTRSSLDEFVPEDLAAVCTKFGLKSSKLRNC